MSPLSARRLLPDDHPVAVADRRVDHRVADHLEQEQRPLADQLARKREDVLDDLLGEDRPAGGDPADDRDVRRLGTGVSGRRLVVDALEDLARPAVSRAVSARLRVGVGGDDLHRPGAVGVAPDVALALERGQLVGDAAGAGEPHPLADLAQARRVAAAVHGVADHLEHPSLPDRQAGSQPALRLPFGHLADLGHRHHSFVGPARAIGVSDRVCGVCVCSSCARRVVGAHRCRSAGLSAPGAALLTWPQTTALERQYQTPVRGVSSVRRTSVLLMAMTSGSYTGSTPTRPDWTVSPVEAPMSAALALDPLALPERAPAPSRPRLQLVPTGPDVVGRPVRISRRGRLARTVGALAIAAALGWTTSARSPRGPPSRSTP